jgi:circadian clock protein KaiC
LAVSVVKKRSGAHERTIREFRIGPTGLYVGPPLSEFHGIFSGIPEHRPDESSTIDADATAG